MGVVIRVYRAASHETLVVVVHDVHSDETVGLVDDAVFEKDGAERDIHLLLEAAPEVIEPGLVVVERERPTGTGPIDLYCERIDLDPLHRPCRGILVAPEIAPQAKVMCGARGYAFVEIDYQVLKGEAAPEWTLFE